MGRRLRWSWIICTVLCAGWISGGLSEDEFECESCKQEQNCTKLDPEDGGRFATDVTDCASGICYVTYGTIEVTGTYEINPTDYPLVSLGCSKPVDNRLPLVDTPPFGAPVFAPLPPPETKPEKEEFVCRNNGPSFRDIKSSMSCFCYTPRCQKDLKILSTSRLFQANLIRSLPVEGTDWVVVDRLGNFKAKTGIKTYDPFKPSGENSAPFSCGECPCRGLFNHNCRRIGRHNCSREGPSLYTVETPCETSHCYLMFGVKEALERWRTFHWDSDPYTYYPEQFVSRGCSSADDTEWADAKNALGNPLYYAWPVPEPLPGPGLWACRRNRPHDHHLSTVTCFCFTSNCQAGYNPKLDEFRNNVNSNLPQGNYWVIVNSEGRKT